MAYLVVSTDFPKGNRRERDRIYECSNRKSWNKIRIACRYVAHQLMNKGLLCLLLFQVITHFSSAQESGLYIMQNLKSIHRDAEKAMDKFSYNDSSLIFTPGQEAYFQISENLFDSIGTELLNEKINLLLVEMKKNLNELNNRLLDISQKNPFQNDTNLKHFTDTIIFKIFLENTALEDSKNIGELKNIHQELEDSCLYPLIILKESNIGNLVEKRNKLRKINQNYQQLTESASNLTKRIQENRNQYISLVQNKIEADKKAKESVEKLTTSPNITIPTTTSTIIPNLNLLGSQIVNKDNGGISYDFLLFMANDFDLEIDSNSAVEVYRKSTTNLFIPEASNFGIMINIARLFYFQNENNKMSTPGVFKVRAYYLNKELPIKSSEDSILRFTGKENTGFFHLQFGGEYYIIKNIFHFYANINSLVALNNVQNYENLFDLSDNISNNFFDVGVAIAFKQLSSENTFALRFGLIFQNDRTKKFTLNDDIGIPTIKLQYTFNRLL